MHQSDDEQPECSSVMETARFALHGFCAAGHQDDSGTEEKRKNRHEFLVCQDMAEYPNPFIDPAEIPVCRGIEIGGLNHGIALYVHDENSEDGKASQNIQR